VTIKTTFVFAAAVFAGCSSHDGGAVDARVNTDADGPIGALLGTFEIELIAPKLEDDGTTTAGHTAILGKIYDGPQPSTVIWDTQAVDGGCTLSTPRVPFCATPCGSSAACVADNTCQAYPTSQSVGAVHVTGVKTAAGASALDLTPIQNSYQPTAAVVLAYPGFAESDAIEVVAAGSSFTGGFTLATRGVAQLALGQRGPIALPGHQAVALTWTPPATGAISTIHVLLDLSHHGGSKGKIECDVADTGALTLGAAMLDPLIALGVAGYPTIIVTRRSIGAAAVANGHAELVVSSQVEMPISVPGTTSCTSDEACTPPAVCQSDLTCK
jgi:hypothetical protein